MASHRRPQALTIAYDDVRDLASDDLLGFISNYATRATPAYLLFLKHPTQVPLGLCTVSLAWNPLPPHIHTVHSVTSKRTTCPRDGTTFYLFQSAIAIQIYLLHPFIYSLPGTFSLLRPTSHPLLHPQYLQWHLQTQYKFAKEMMNE